MPDVDFVLNVEVRSSITYSSLWGGTCFPNYYVWNHAVTSCCVTLVVFGVDLADVDRLAKAIPAAPGKVTTIPEALEGVPELTQLYDSEDTVKLLDYAMS